MGCKKKGKGKPRRWMVLLPFLFLMPGCVTDPSYVAFVKADRLRQEAIGSQWMTYVLSDPAKSPAQRADAQALLDAWAADLQANEVRTGLR